VIIIGGFLLSGAIPSDKRLTTMSERLTTLKAARARMVEDRDAHAKVLAAPFNRDNAERARSKFVEIQNVIDAIDSAIRGEEASAQPPL
jgi:outer membrane murein-binding lipoprotein Lpp